MSIIYLSGTLDWKGFDQLEFFLDHSLEYLQDRIFLNLLDIDSMDSDCFMNLVHKVMKIREFGWEIGFTILNANEGDVISDFAITDILLEFPSLLKHTTNFPLHEMNLPG